ncbi:MAG TPA: hypothetical protein VHB79_38870 [Polyangiaceae bacterium]|nr:hypothetical protein [Polyangiaceae bacterium]
MSTPADPTDLRLAAAVVAPWACASEPPPLVLAVEALNQLSAELCVLRAALCEGDEGEGPLATEIVSRAITGIEERARVAAQVAERLSKKREVRQ